MLFNDKEKLYELIKDGKFLNTGFNTSDPIFDIDYYKRTFFAAAMHTLWLTGENRRCCPFPSLQPFCACPRAFGLHSFALYVTDLAGTHIG